MPSILIIDDDDSLRDALHRTLHKEGYIVMEASEGGRGLKQLESSPADLILLDMFMPDKDGLETIGELRRAHPKIPIIAMSGGGSRGTVDVLHVAKKLGVRRTLAKPFTREQLLDAVREELIPH
ncbi:MAG: response regulator [Nitrospira sp. CG24E]|nr:MAG: response regulator [Nitrospira sp. CG24E]